jgi:pimeloyl-ACP methyl ester carboxylesterase
MPETNAAVEHVTSSDGTRIAYRRSGEGPRLVLVHGTTGAHWSFNLLVPTLVDRFTVYAIDRRGRGASGDRAEYSIEREFEDVAAVVDSIDEPASLFGHSYGATVALGAALVARNLHKLVVYEPAPGVSAVASEDLERIEDLVARGEREEALVHALGSFGLALEEVEELRASRTWSDRVAGAHTVAREVRAEEAYRVDPERFGELTAPVLLLLGEKSPDWAPEGTERIRAVLPNAQVALLAGQGHMATVTAPELVADELAHFLGG